MAAARRVGWAAPGSVAALWCVFSLAQAGGADAVTYATLTVTVARVINPEAQHGLASGYCDGSLSAGCDVYLMTAV